MKRLLKYFMISLLCNTIIIIILILPAKVSGTKRMNGNNSIKGFSLIPANLLHRYDELKKSSENAMYRPVDTDKEAEKQIDKQKKEALEKERNIEEKKAIDIPHSDKVPKNYLSKEEYKRYKNAHIIEGTTLVADMHVKFPPGITEKTMQEIISYFGFKIVAYPDHNPDYLIVADGTEYQFRKLNTKDTIKDFYSDNSNRTIELDEDLVSWIRSGLERQGVRIYNLKISLALGDSSGYFHWKEMLAIKNVSKPITDISYTEARITMVSQGYWILLIEGICLKNGQYIKVQDQELKEIIL